ncbi:MAG: hypothetical protein R3321_13810, partial [Nitrososphaeraceae archaeon]|nr:hypothetical protein [Nitrososphaeraceae archaeon]
MLATPSLRTKKFIFLLIIFLGLVVSVHYGITNNLDQAVTKVFYDLSGIYTVDIAIIVISSLGDLFIMVIVGA